MRFFRFLIGSWWGAATIVTPPSRIFLVTQEQRFFQVEPDTRNFLVEFELRSFQA